MIKHTITSGDVNVVATGSVFSFKGEPISIKLSQNTIVFDFSGEHSAKTVIKARDERTQVVQIGKIKNGWPAKPAALGENEKSVLYLMFHVRQLSPETFHLDYTFFAEPKKKVMKANERAIEKNSKKD